MVLDNGDQLSVSPPYWWWSCSNQRPRRSQFQPILQTSVRSRLMKANFFCRTSTDLIVDLDAMSRAVARGNIDIEVGERNGVTKQVLGIHHREESHGEVDRPSSEGEHAPG